MDEIWMNMDTCYPNILILLPLAKVFICYDVPSILLDFMECPSLKKKITQAAQARPGSGSIYATSAANSRTNLQNIWKFYSGQKQTATIFSAPKGCQTTTIKSTKLAKSLKSPQFFVVFFLVNRPGMVVKTIF